MHEVLLHERDEGQQIPRERIGPAHACEPAEERRIDVGEHLAHDHRFLEAVEQQPVRVRQVVGLAVVVAQPSVDPRRQLARGAGRERQDEDLAPVGHAGADRLLIEVDEGMGLTGARAGEHTNRAVDVANVEWQRLPWVGDGRSGLCGGVLAGVTRAC